MGWGSRGGGAGGEARGCLGPPSPGCVLRSCDRQGQPGQSCAHPDKQVLRGDRRSQERGRRARGAARLRGGAAVGRALWSRGDGGTGDEKFESLQCADGNRIPGTDELAQDTSGI